MLFFTVHHIKMHLLPIEERDEKPYTFTCVLLCTYRVAFGKSLVYRDKEVYCVGKLLLFG